MCVRLNGCRIQQCPVSFYYVVPPGTTQFPERLPLTDRTSIQVRARFCAQSLIAPQVR